MLFFKQVLHFVSFFSLVLLLNNIFILPSASVVEGLNKGYKVYDPLWSVKENGGSLPLNTLAPYELVNEKQKRKKKPLILIHGTVSDGKPYCNWSFLLNELRKEKETGKTDEYNVYIYRYPSSNADWQDLSLKLNTGLKELLSDYPKGTELKLVVSSLGGILFCDAVAEDKVLSAKIKRVISLGTPFWGTPLLKENLTLNTAQNKTFNWLLYQSTNFLFPALSNRIAWALPFNDVSFPTNKCDRLKTKFINYAAFYDSPLTKGIKVNDKQVADWVFNKIQHSDYRHSWNAVMHYKMGWEINRSLKEPYYLFAYNDGLVPIYSSLWLDPQVDNFKDEKVLTESILQKIKQMNPRARLFPGLDHTDCTEVDSAKAINSPQTDILNNSHRKIAKSIIEDLN